MSEAQDLIKKARELTALADKATPGPWSKDGLFWLLRFSKKNAGNWEEEVKDHEYLPDEDDASLIAAAPDMARLLKQMADELEARINDEDVE
jgi:hypothetical protein